MKKILLVLFLLLTVIMYGLGATYTSQYPTPDADHVKATTELEHYEAPLTADPNEPLTGGSYDNCWQTNLDGGQRFHIDLGSAKIIRRIYYENFHSGGALTDRGSNDFTFWGSNTEASFLELTYGTDTGWTEITTATTVFIEHVASDEADPYYITATNTTAYQYYAVKIATNHTNATKVGLRRIELQTEDGYGEEENAIWFGFCF